MRRNPKVLIPLLAASIMILFVMNLLLGSVSIPLREVLQILLRAVPENSTRNDIWLIHSNIIWSSRVPQSLTAMAAGAGLAVAGLQMQTVFHNPLAGPSILGISSGAALGVALVVLLSGAIGGSALSNMGYIGDAALSIAAIIGAMSVMALITFVAQRVKGKVTLLIIGVMIGYMTSAIIGVLKYFSDEDDVRAYMVWGLGSFSRVSGNNVVLFLILMAILLPLAFLLIKPMNLLLLGEGYARNLGLNIRKARLEVILCSSMLVAVVTAYCGPILFIGLAVPHLCRSLFRTNNHSLLVPASLFTGTALALLCNLIARMPGFEGVLPVNSVTALIGAPIVMSVLLKHQKEETNY